MTQEWAPSFWGRKLTRSPNWRLSLDDLELSLRLDGRIHAIHVQNEMAYRVNSGVLWTDITFYPGQELETKVDGLPTRVRQQTSIFPGFPAPVHCKSTT